jgi:hypothetical protein
MRFFVLVALLASQTALFVTSHAAAQTVLEREPWRPPPLEATTKCDVYTGTGSGNDPSQLVELRVCDNGTGAVSGQAQYSGRSAGWSLRTFTGAWSTDKSTLVLHEDAIIDQRPSPHWHFCTVDRYDLARNGDALAGTYDSAACHDHAELSLVKTATIVIDAGSGANAEEPLVVSSAPPPPASSVASPPPAQPAKSSCKCDTPGSARHGSPWAVLVLLALARTLRHRSPLRRCALRHRAVAPSARSVG